MRSLVLLLLALPPCLSPELAEADGAPAPAWLVDHMRYLVADGDEWVADNQRYRGAEELFDSYVVRYRWAIGRTSIVGTLHGLQGERRVGPFWEYRLFWDPDRRRATFEQFGRGGRIELGTLDLGPRHRLRLEQRFSAPGELPRRSAHDWGAHSPEVHHTVSYDRGSGGWSKGREYQWTRRQAAPRDSG